MAVTSPDTRGSEAAQARKQAPNCSGSSAAHTREKVFLQGMPAEKGKYSRRKSSFSCPNITKSRQLSAPQIEPHSSTAAQQHKKNLLQRIQLGALHLRIRHLPKMLLKPLNHLSIHSQYPYPLLSVQQCTAQYFLDGTALGVAQSDGAWGR